MRYLAAITLLVLAMALAQPVAAQSFNAGFDAAKRGDYATALKHFRPLANQGHAAAQNNLGWMYHRGHGVTQDYAEALRLFRLSAKQGNAMAQTNVGLMYHRGYGVTQDYAEALHLFRLSAKQGNAMAQHNVGLMYHRGHGVTQDYAEALRWYRLSAKQGNAQARTNLAKLEKQLRREGNWPPRSRQASKPPAPLDPPQAAVKKPKTTVAAPFTSDGGYSVQLAAVRVESAARGEWRRLRERHAELLGNLSLNVVRADLGPKGIFYRLRAGPLADKATARALCQVLAKKKVGCLVIPPGE
jgi:TPR repeat protein